MNKPWQEPDTWREPVKPRSPTPQITIPRFFFVMLLFMAASAVLKMDHEKSMLLIWEDSALNHLLLLTFQVVGFLFFTVFGFIELWKWAREKW